MYSKVFWPKKQLLCDFFFFIIFFFRSPNPTIYTHSFLEHREAPPRLSTDLSPHLDDRTDTPEQQQQQHLQHGPPVSTGLAEPGQRQPVRQERLHSRVGGDRACGGCYNVPSDSPTQSPPTHLWPRHAVHWNSSKCHRHESWFIHIFKYFDSICISRI